MNRRGHLSHKVPNVKLRPAPAPAPLASSSTGTRRSNRRAPSPSEEVWREQFEGGSDEDDDPMIGDSARPWQGIVITFTGIDDKPRLTELVKHLGGTVESALTIHVTHVVAEGFGSPKYNYAVENRIPIMTPSWIIDTHDKWVSAVDFDPVEEEEEHRLQPFAGLRIAISGIENLERRKQILHWVNASGGVYSKDLDRSCTHLVSAKITSDSKSSEKVKWALREIAQRETARRRGKKLEGEDMKIVYEEWIWDCIAYRGRWREELYDARKPRPKAKVRAEDVLDGSVFSAQEEKKSEVQKEEEGPAVVKKRKREAMDSLVGDIISTAARPDKPIVEGSGEIPAPVPEPVHAKNVGLGTSTSTSAITARTHPADARREPERKPSLLHQTRTAAFEQPQLPNRTPSDSKPTSSFPPTAPAQPSHTDSTATLPLPAAVVEADVKVEGGSLEPDDKFFDGLRFSHIIEERCDGLEEALVVHGGKFVPEKERLAGAEVDYVVIRLRNPKIPVQVQGVKVPEVVTECWVEACCHERRMFSPDDHIVFRPLPGPTPVPGVEALRVHLSGFGSADQTYLRRLLKAIGGTLSEKMNKQTTHLVSATNDSAKARKAPEWGVKLVKQSWLLAIGKNGRMEPEDEHLFPPPPPVVPAERKLDATHASMANMSVLLELGDPTYERADNRPANSAPLPQAQTTSQRSAPFSPSRMLKLTPTHIDDKGVGLLGNGSNQNVTKQVEPSNVLSPPKQGTERLLNNADEVEGGVIASQGKVGKTMSAPPNAESLKSSERSSPARSNPLRGSSTGGPTEAAALKKKSDMTDVLRHLAEQADTPSAKSRMQRRQRPASRLKTSLGASGRAAHTASASVSPHKRLTPDIFDQDLVAPDADEAMDDTDRRDGKVQDETVRVDYIDSNAEREKKKLLDAMKRVERSRAKADAVPEAKKSSPKGASPHKRTRR